REGEARGGRARRVQADAGNRSDAQAGERGAGGAVTPSERQTATSLQPASTLVPPARTPIQGGSCMFIVRILILVGTISGFFTPASDDGIGIDPNGGGPRTTASAGDHRCTIDPNGGACTE